MENKDSVAYVEVIESITPIVGADKIELATVQGWTSTVQKGIHKVGDLVLCVTTDAVIPQDLAEKWGVAQYLRKGNRVRTVKLKGVYSECILIPYKDLHEPVNYMGWDHENWKKGLDWMSNVNIYKYEPPARTEVLPGGKKIRYSCNPNFHVYYKFPNQKNTPNMFKEGDECVITRKIHGTNARYAIVKKTKFTLGEKIKKFFGFWSKWNDYEYVYGSHNVQKFNDLPGYYTSNYWKEIDEKYNIEAALWKLLTLHGTNEFENIVIYGEIYGPGVQGDSFTYGKTEREFVGFDIELNGKYIDIYHKSSIFKELNLPTVEVLCKGKWSKEIQDEYVFNNFIGDTKVPHEGVVVSCPTGDRQKICKVINPDYTIYSEKNNVPDSH